MSTIQFFDEDISFKLNEPDHTINWIKKVIKTEGFEIGDINFIFCSDEYLHEINKEYLNHDTFTDIITFDNSDESGIIEGDIFISIDRIGENALSFNREFEEELYRVIIHGILHLLGYNDKHKEEKATMRKKEEACLSLRK